MVARTIIAAPSGFLVEAYGYTHYFGLTFILALPAFLLLPQIKSRLEAS